MTVAARRLAAALVAIACAGCPRPGQDRALGDLEVGRAQVAGVAFAVEGGLAHVLAAEPGALHLRASAPVFAIDVDTASGAARSWSIAVDNAMPGAELVATDADGAAIPVTASAGARPTERRFALDLPAGRARLVVAPPDAAVAEPWRFAAMSDIQDALADVDEVFAAVSADPSIRFVASAGDLVERASVEEYELFLAQLEALAVPYYATNGNHELLADPRRWRERFGRFSVFFSFKGVAFSLVDSGDASIDPVVYSWLESWLASTRGQTHVFMTHFPPFDPVGIREGSFRSRAEASKLLAILAEGGVDLTIYGHIHSLYTYENAGIQAYISGGGGAYQERWDGIGRHFLVVDVSADGVDSVGVVRVD